MDNSRFMPMVQAFMGGPNAQPGSEWRAAHPRIDQFLTAHPNFDFSQFGQGRPGLGQGMFGGGRPDAPDRPAGFGGNGGMGGPRPGGGILGGFGGGQFGGGMGGNPAPRPSGPPAYNTGIVPPHMGGSPVPPPPMQHMGPGSGLAPPARPQGIQRPAGGVFGANSPAAPRPGAQPYSLPNTLQNR